MAIVDPRAVRAAITTRLKDHKVDVITRSENRTTGRWVHLDGPRDHEDPLEKDGCGGTDLSVVEVTLVCVGRDPDPAKAEQYAGWVTTTVARAMKTGPLLPGTLTPTKMPGRPFGPEDESSTVWSASLVYAFQLG